jgi:hypothetical protein
LASAYKKLAADPYGYIVELEQAKGQREMTSAIVYGADQHRAEANPYLGTNLTAQSALARDNAAKAERYRFEAQPVQLPFGKNLNQTKRAMLIKKHPRAYEMLERAQAAREAWRANEKIELKKQSDIALAKLKAIESA